MTSAVTSPGQFARLAASLTRPTPIVEAFDVARWPAAAFETRWYANQQEHVVGFAAAYPDRQPTATTRQMYGRFANPSCPLWIAEAFGVDPALVQQAADAALAARTTDGRMAAEAGAVRKVVPWVLLVEKISEAETAAPVQAVRWRWWPRRSPREAK